MSVSIGTNTQELQEILQTVYELPNSTSGGSAEPDLVVSMQLPQGNALQPSSSSKVVLSIKSGSAEDVHAKLMNRESVNVVMEHDFWYSNTNFVGVFYPSIVTTLKNTYDPNEPDAIGLNFLVNGFPGSTYSVCQINMIIGVDGEIYEGGIHNP